MHPSVSIIVPVYGVEKYLDRCVESLVKQTLTDIEIILVDDGSPDNCPRMCDDWAHRDSRIKVIHKSNAGQGFARNSGIEIATGEYIAFVDSDDYMEPDTYATLYSEAINNGYDAVFNGYAYHNPDGSVVNKAISDRTYCGPDAIKQYISDLLIDDDIVVSVCMGIYRSQIINKHSISFLSERRLYSEDLLFNLDFVHSVSSIRCLPKAFYHYCFNGQSFSITIDNNKINSCFNLYAHIIKKLETFNMSNLNQIAMIYLLNQMVVILKNIMLANSSLSEKRLATNIIFDFSDWKQIYTSLKHVDNISMLKQILLWCIRYKMFWPTLLFFKTYYGLIK